MTNGETAGAESEPKRGNGLGRFAGTWSEKDLEEFQRSTAFFDEVDPAMWECAVWPEEEERSLPAQSDEPDAI